MATQDSTRFKRNAIIAGILSTVLLAGGIVAGSRNLAHFDAALVGYTFACLFATFGIVYRYAMWIQRPPTAMYFRRGWLIFLQPRTLVHRMLVLARRVVVEVLFNRFIMARGQKRWAAHWLIMIGCVMAIAITFPLVFGWIHFETIGGKGADPGQFAIYRTYVFGFPVHDMAIHSFEAFIVFHGLVWAAFLVIAGVMLAMWRRMKDQGAAAVQQFGEDFMPLIMLFAISVTGLMLTASYTWMRGYAYDFIAILHAITVIFTLLWLPFGKFFHIIQRPAHLGVLFYKDFGKEHEQARCKRCGDAFASALQVRDLMVVEKQLGFMYESDGDVEHYQMICPKCRRAMFGLAQGQLWNPESPAELIQNGGR
ncbi:MAG TPA: MFS transporter [Phycisphaerae bacterium]|nr:MFS transporter [Phycisphaerae bacterium]